MSRKEGSNFKLQVILITVSTLFGLFMVEIGLRVVCKKDADGDLSLRYTTLKPIHYPVAKISKLIDRYEKESATATLMFDPDLGWIPHPGTGGFNSGGFFSSNPEPSKYPPPGCLRIALMGGSYTQCSPVAGWWKILESRLKARGMNVEVLNFGVSGYGMDQAWMRWKKTAEAYHPQLVIFGFVSGNSMTNVNVLRILSEPDTGIPFTKPRFIIDGDSLRQVNNPVPAPGEMVRLVSSLSSWPLLKYDYYYKPDDFCAHWWRYSRLFSLIESKLTPNYRQEMGKYYQMDGEPARLALKIIQRFRDDVEQSGSKFVIINLPQAAELGERIRKGYFPYQELYSEVRKLARVINPEQPIIETIGKKNVWSFFNDDHYAESLHSVVGEFAASYIETHFTEYTTTAHSDK